MAAEIILDRSMGYYLIQFFVPVVLLTLVAYSSVWVDRTNLTLRVGVAVVAVLGLIAVMAGFNTLCPKISYIKSTDVYAGVGVILGCVVVIRELLLRLLPICECHI